MSGDHVHQFGGSEFAFDAEAPRVPRRGASGDGAGGTAIRSKAIPDRPVGVLDADGAAGIEGADETGLIRVRINDSGEVTDVLIPSDWQDKIDRLELGTALRTAANNAFTSRMADELAKIDLDELPDAAAQPDEPRELAKPDPDLDHELLDLFACFDRDYAIYRTQLRAAVPTSPVSTRGANGRIEVTMQPGHVSAVTVDPRWVQYARYTEIRAEAKSAFRSASRQAGSGRVNSVPLPATLVRLQELASDPRLTGRSTGSA